MNRTIFNTPVVTGFFRGLSVMILNRARWCTIGPLPDIPKFVMIAAPHTSNWDFPLMLLMAFRLGGQPRWLGKKAIFRKPFAGLFKWLGGIPVDRSRANNLVEAMVARFHRMDRLILVVPPAGTRKRVAQWKTGFYHIAAGAGIPVVLGFLDFKKKMGGVGPVVLPTGDIDRDMPAIRAFYAGIAGKHPHQSLVHAE